MRIVLAAWAMMFFALLLSWAFVRAGPGSSPAGDAPLPSPLLAGLATACLAAASGALFVASRAAEGGRRRAIQVGLLACLAFAAAAIGLEVPVVLEGRHLRMGGSHGAV